MRILMLALFLSLSALGQTDGARVLTGSAQPPLPYNILPQPGYENRTTGWSVTSGTFTTTQSSDDVGRGRFSASWTVPASTSSGILLQSDPITVPAGLRGRQCVGIILSKGNAGTNGTMTLDAYDGTNIYGARAISDSTFYSRTATTVFTCPISGTLRLRVRTTASSPASPAAVFFDEAYLGENAAVGSGGGGAYDVTPTVDVTDSDTITFIPATRGIVYVQGDGGAVTADGTLPLTAGTENGQELMLVGRSDDNTVRINDGGNVKQNGDVFLYENSSISYIWDSVNSKWIENARVVK